MIKAHGETGQSALIHEGKATLHGINVNTDKTNDLTVTVFDNTQADGKILWRQTVVGTDVTGGAFFAAQGIAVEKGIYIRIETEGAGTANVYYRM